MTPKQRKFADEYLLDNNATRAYKAAYPTVKSDETAAAAGARLLRNVKVEQYISAKLEEMSSKKIAGVIEIRELLTSVMRGESVSSVVVVEGTGKGCSSARVIEKPPDGKERLKAAELLGKSYRMFTDNVSFDGVVSVVFSGEDELED